MSRMQPALDRNQAFAAAGGNRGITVMPDLGLMVVTCLDPRVDPAAFLGLGLGDAMVLRNAGGRVTSEVVEDVAFIGQLAGAFLPEGRLFEVAVVHHTECGTGMLVDGGFRREYADRIGADEETLVERAVTDPEATVRTDVERLRAAPAIPDRVTSSGHVYDLETGLVHLVVDG